MKFGKLFLLTLAFMLGACSGTKHGSKSETEAVSKTTTTKSTTADAMAKEEKAQAIDWEKIGKPGPQHQMLAPLAGKWTTNAKFWTKPGTPAEITKGQSDLSWIFGGRFLKENYTGQFQGKPFTGMGLIGFDNVTGKFSSLWIDSMATGMMTSEGQADETGKKFVFFGHYADPITGEMKKTRMNLQIMGQNQRIVEMFERDTSTGQEWKTMEITYSRVGGKKAAK